jgi:cyclopropane fatty-acyl-phospholipid synthase-like methyltransferase
MSAHAEADWGEARADALWRDLFARYTPVVDRAVVLDVGCSWGYVLRHLAAHHRPRRLVGVDTAAHWEAAGDARDPAIELHCCELAELDAIDEGSVDLVLCTATLEHMTPEGVEATLRRASALLRPGGRAILRIGIFASAARAERQPRYVNWLTPSTYGTIFRRAGLEVLDLRSDADQLDAHLARPGRE